MRECVYVYVCSYVYVCVSDEVRKCFMCISVTFYLELKT